MNVASKELCQELHELSGWEPQQLWMVDQDTNIGAYRYDLGYLLRKLPEADGKTLELMTDLPNAGMWTCGWQHATLAHDIYESADAPEDAACKLSIELFKQGILKRES